MEQEITREQKIKEIIQVWHDTGKNEGYIKTNTQTLEKISDMSLNKTYTTLMAENNKNKIAKKEKSLGSGDVDVKELKDYIDQKVSAAEVSLKKEVNKNLKAIIIDNLPSVNLNLNGKELPASGKMQHKLFPKLLAICSTKVGNHALNVWLTGPAGSGKTKGCENVAESLGLDFYFNGAIDTPYKLTGFVDANGKIVSTAFKDAYTNGGLYLFDEVDASMPGALLAFNAALANGFADFPEGRVARHNDCIIVAAANTWGSGPNSEYVGRNKLDAAFLDRFVQLAWGYDDKLERGLTNHDSWVNYVQKVRHNVLHNKLQAVISPRASMNGAAMLRTGAFSVEEVVNMTLKKGMKDDIWQQASAGISFSDVDPTDGGRFELANSETIDQQKKKKSHTM